MNDVMESGGTTASDAERTTLLICYILQGVGIFTGGLGSIVGVIISHIKVADTTNDFIRSHHRWLIRTFWFGLLWTAISTVLVIIAIGVLGYLAVGIWLIYRVVRGVLAFTERRSMPA